jgi:2-methylisocitrate lyase-like PEP mutase family enzyme
VLERNKAFRNELLSRETSFICEAHNGLSAKIVEESGFSGIWASGLSISAQYGLRDNNEASWSQVLDAVELMPALFQYLSMEIQVLVISITFVSLFASWSKLEQALFV